MCYLKKKKILQLKQIINMLSDEGESKASISSGAKIHQEIK